MNVPKLRFKEFSGEWERKTLEKVAEIHDSKRIPLKETDRLLRKGRFPYYGASGVIDFIDDYIFDGEYVLLGEDGANIITRSTKLAFLVSGKFWVNNHAHVFRAKESNFFLAEVLERINYEPYNSGTVQPKLNIEACKKIILFIPSLLEQTQIASFLTAIDEKIAQLTQKHELLSQYKKGVMQQIFSQQLRFKDDNGEDFGEWEEKALGEVAIFFNGRAYKQTEWEKQGTPVIRLQNLTGSGTEYYYSNLELPEHQYCYNDDLLYMWSATFGPVFWKGEKAIYHYHIWKIVTHETILSKLFLFYLLALITDEMKSTSNRHLS